jgi:hypothetical protein
MSDFDGLLSALAGVPRLDGARCVGQHAMFDEYDCPDTVAACVYVCDHCAAKPACEDYLNGLRPSQRPFGVTAGVVRRPREPRKPKEAA